VRRGWWIGLILAAGCGGDPPAPAPVSLAPPPFAGDGTVARC
jgi:hypothetical protein